MPPDTANGDPGANGDDGALSMLGNGGTAEVESKLPPPSVSRSSVRPGPLDRRVGGGWARRRRRRRWRQFGNGGTVACELALSVGFTPSRLSASSVIDSIFTRSKSCETPSFSLTSLSLTLTLTLTRTLTTLTLTLTHPHPHPHPHSHPPSPSPLTAHVALSLSLTLTLYSLYPHPNSITVTLSPSPCHRQSDTLNLKSSPSTLRLPRCARL